MKKAEGIAPVIRLQRSNRFGQAAVNTPPPHGAGRTNGAVGNPELANPLSLQGAGRGKVYGVTAKSQEMTKRSRRQDGSTTARQEIFQA
jgi:hypothetical protein